LRAYLARHNSVAEGFGRVWEQTLEEVALEEPDQAQIYWELIQWARSYELFTRPPVSCLESRSSLGKNRLLTLPRPAR
jgi:hypothetical protein